MKNLVIVILLSMVVFEAKSQTTKSIGAGYYGHTITHPGIVVEYEIAKQFDKGFSLPLRLNTGFYIHPRYNNGIFIDAHYGLRKTTTKGWYFEESIGLGTMSTFLNSDGVYSVDEVGQVIEASRFNIQEFTPSVTVGIGKVFKSESDHPTSLWIRPKVIWHIPNKLSASFSPIVQIGYSRRL